MISNTGSSAQQNGSRGGYNHNISYRGRVFHVQTEDLGQPRTRIVTQIFLGGAVLQSIRTDYENISSAEGFSEQIRSMMKTQHREMIRLLARGELDLVIPGSGRDEQEQSAKPAVVSANISAKRPYRGPTASEWAGLEQRLNAVEPVTNASISSPSTEALDDLAETLDRLLAEEDES